MRAHQWDLRAEAPPDRADVLCSADFEVALDEKQRALIAYALKLTLTPQACSRADVEALRSAGARDEEIHATVQVAAYFNYVNRVADALGVDLEPEMRAEQDPGS